MFLRKHLNILNIILYINTYSINNYVILFWNVCRIERHTGKAISSENRSIIQINNKFE